jgi:hypothetical protein
VAVSELNRSRFKLLSKERIAVALATGTIQTLGISESAKAEAIEWVAEQEAAAEASKRIDENRYKTIRLWTIVAAVASIIAAVASVISLFR